MRQSPARFGALSVFALLGALLAACSKKAAEPTPGAAVSAAAPRASISAAKAVTKDIPPPEDVAKPPANAGVTATGLVSRVLVAGKGDAHPTDGDMVAIRYTSWTRTGHMIDSTSLRTDTAILPLGDLVDGWKETLKLMVTGETRRAWIPQSLLSAVSPRMRAGDQTYDFELVDIYPPPPRPADFARPPKTAKSTPSGLKYVVLKPGTGTVHPGPREVVKVHYSGWTMNEGRLFDSSEHRRQPSLLALSKLIKGWTEGVQLMVVGERRRLWIPAELAYGKQPRRPELPAGPLVFEIELLEIQDMTKPAAPAASGTTL